MVTKKKLNSSYELLFVCVCVLCDEFCYHGLLQLCSQKVPQGAFAVTEILLEERLLAQH